MIVILDDGSLWKRTKSSNKITTWTHLLLNAIDRYKFINLYHNCIIQNSNIYKEGYPYWYMSNEERIKHGYIQCNCCELGKSCGYLTYKNTTKTTKNHKKPQKPQKPHKTTKQLI